MFYQLALHAKPTKELFLFLNTISGGETKGPASKRNMLREASIQSSYELQSGGKYEL